PSAPNRHLNEPRLYRDSPSGLGNWTGTSTAGFAKSFAEGWGFRPPGRPVPLDTPCFYVGFRASTALEPSNRSRFIIAANRSRSPGTTRAKMQPWFGCGSSPYQRGVGERISAYRP